MMKGDPSSWESRAQARMVPRGASRLSGTVRLISGTFPKRAVLPGTRWRDRTWSSQAPARRRAASLSSVAFRARASGQEGAGRRMRSAARRAQMKCMAVKSQSLAWTGFFRAFSFRDLSFQASSFQQAQAMRAKSWTG